MEKWCSHNAVTLISNVYKCTEPSRQTMNNLEINHSSLKLKRRQLIEKVSALKSQVTAAQAIGKNPDNEVIGWLSDAEDRITTLNKILGAEDAQLPQKCPGGCLYLNCFSAYQYAKMLEDMIIFVDQLIEAGEFSADKIFKSNPAAPGPSQGVDVHIVGLDNKLCQLYSLLQEPGFRSIAIHGMGGVGKTTLLKRVHQRLLEDNLGKDEEDNNMVIWVDMSHVNSSHSARLTIGEKLGLTTFENAVNQNQITNALQEKKFVLLLDDLRDVNRLELADIGVPMNIKSKVVFTTRHPYICDRMGAGLADHQIQLECLTGKDPWILFMNALRETEDNCDPTILVLAKKVAELCRGLPLALYAMGSSMRGYTSPNEWMLAERRLVTLNLEAYGMDEDVFQVLNISYENLRDPSKSCLLYVSLFPETCLQHEDDLIHYWISEKILTEFHQLKDNLIHGRSVIENLRRSYLLEHDHGTKLMKMHGMMRGAALWITRGKFYVRWDDTLDGLPTDINWEAVERVSLIRNSIDILSQAQFSNLSTLILKNSTVREVSYDFFNCMPRLNVLDLSGTNMENFPLGITNLTTLQYLNISHTRVQDLPTELTKLSQLKFLDLSYPLLLYRIPRQVLGHLNRLQSLNLYQSGTVKRIQQSSTSILAQEDEGNVLSKDSNVLLTELEQLHHLGSLGITIRSLPALQNLQKSKHLRCLHSMFITKCKGLTSLHVPSSDYHTAQNLKVFRVCDCPDLLELAIPSGRRFANLSQIEIKGCGKLKDISWINYAPCLHLLKIENCNRIEVVSSDPNTAATQFSSLRFMHLSYLPELKLFCNLELSLPLLEQITVLYCPKMKKLPLAAANAQRALKSITINKNLWDKLVWDEETAKSALGHPCEFK